MRFIFAQRCLGLLALLAAFLPISGRSADTAPTRRASTERINYVLTPNDIVELRVFQEDDLNAKLRIGKDGTVNAPLLGYVKIGGKTSDQAADSIRELLAKDYLVNPQVAVSIVEYSKRRFTVLGQVSKPGTYDMPDEESINLLQAVALAGGFTRIANRGNVSVTREVNGQRMVYKLDAKSMGKDRDVSAFEVLPGDTIVVDEGLL